MRQPAKTTYRIVEKDPAREYTVDATAHEFRDGLIIFYDRGLKLVVAASKVERIVAGE
jgi:hypothetical protein